MFHAVAMPVSSLGDDTPVEAKTHHTVSHLSFHCDNLTQDDIKVQKCCSGAALPTVLHVALMIGDSQKNHASLAPRLIRQFSDVLFKPPKVDLVLTG